MSEDNIGSPWKIAKNGKSEYALYDDLAEADHVKLQLRLEDGSSVTIGNFRYVFKIYNDRPAIVFRNPIKGGVASPSSSERQSNSPQPYVVLSIEHINWLKQAATNSERTLQIVKRIEEGVFAPPASLSEIEQDQKHQDDEETHEHV